MKDRALVLGGGGPVGVAWEAGLLAGLADEGVDVRRADFVLGTSAGSIVGSAVAKGVDLDMLAEIQRSVASVTPGAAGAPDLSKLMPLMMRFPPIGEPSLDLRKELGALSLSGQTMSEDAFIAMLAAGLPPGDWPDKFACTAVDTDTGEFHVWRKADGVELARAVSSSCSVPSIFPAVTINRRRWMDGGMRSSVSIDVAAGYTRVLTVAVIPAMARAWLGPRFEAEAEAVRAQGGEMKLIAPDDASSEAFGANLMDGLRRPASMEAGRAQGRREAERLKAWWS
jgi:NTE family protein